VHSAGDDHKREVMRLCLGRHAECFIKPRLVRLGMRVAVGRNAYVIAPDQILARITNSKVKRLSRLDLNHVCNPDNGVCVRDR